MDESDLYIASSTDSLADFLRTELSRGKRVHCNFTKSTFERDRLLVNDVEKRGLAKITFMKE